jgi:hypothetical protein
LKELRGDVPGPAAGALPRERHDRSKPEGQFL